MLHPLHPVSLLQAEQAAPNDAENEVVLKSTLLITLGNAHYEHSIVRAAGGLDWRPLVEQAAAKFREAGELAGLHWLPGLWPGLARGPPARPDLGWLACGSRSAQGVTGGTLCQPHMRLALPPPALNRRARD